MVGVAALAAAASTAATYQFARQPPVASSMPPAASVAPATSGLAPTSSRRVDMRALIRQAIQQAPVHQSADLESYLDSLEEQARRNGRVTALEVEPGVFMIRKYGNDQEKIAAFAERMQQVQQELEGTQEEPERASAETFAKLRDVLHDIRTARDEAHKQELIGQYLALTRALPPDARARAFEDLNRIAAPPQEPPDPAALDLLSSAIQRAAPGAEREALIRDYIELVKSLPMEERNSRMRGLDGLDAP